MGPLHDRANSPDNEEVAFITQNAENVKVSPPPPQLWRPYLDEPTESSRSNSSCWSSPPKLYDFSLNVPREFYFRPVSFHESSNYESHHVLSKHFPQQPCSRKTPELTYGWTCPPERPSPESGRTTPENALCYFPSRSTYSPSSSIASTDDVKMSPKKRSKTSGTCRRNHPYSSERLKRSKFTEEQLKYLNEAFFKQTYLTLQDRHDLALKLTLSEEQVKNWFQNKRMKTKRDYIHAVDKGLVIPLENPGLPKFSRMPVNYFTSLPASPVKFILNGL